jgi:glycosyltransferase involved in cell wall biosynthesis
VRALVVLYYFPPSGGPGVQRGVKLCRHLRELGVETTVVTVEPRTYLGPGEYAPDSSMAAEVPSDVRVVRTAGGERRRLKEAVNALKAHRAAQHAAPSWFFERQAGWLAPALAACEDEVARSRPDVLLTSSQPYTAHLVGLALRARTGVPWVADFRDPWTTSWGRTWPSARAFRWEESREDAVFAAADRVVANTDGSRTEMLARRPWVAPAKVAVVPNGYDPEDFAIAPAPRDPGDFVVVHSGAFRAAAAPPFRGRLRRWLDGRAVAPIPYDLATHSPLPLLRALADEAVAGAPRRVRARLVGPLAPAWLLVARSLGVADRVEALGPLPHREAVSHVLAADLLYLPTVTRTDGGPVSNVPAKTYEYLGSGRPVAALAGPGDVRDLVAGRDRVTLLEPSDEDGLAALIARGATDGLPSAPPDPEDAHAWRRAEVARRMAAVLRAVTGKG